MTFLVSSLLYLSLPKKDLKAEDESVNSLINLSTILSCGKEVLKNSPEIKRHFFYLIIIVSAYQGFHTVARTVIPINNIGLGAQGVTLYQASASFALILSTFVVYKLVDSDNSFLKNPVFLILASMICMIITVYPKNIYLGLVSYFIFVFVYEIAFIKCMNFMVVNCTKDKMKVLIPLSNSCLFGCLAFSVFVGGTLVDMIGIMNMSYIFAFLTVVALLSIEPNRNRIKELLYFFK